MNPDLLPAGVDPAAAARVQPLNTLTAPYPLFKVAPKCYVTTVPAASMHRPDGKRLAFVHGFLQTDQKYDIDYLDAEIAQGNSYIREATIAEITIAKMKIDPVGTIRDQLRPQIEAELRGEIEAQIRAEIAAAAAGDGTVTVNKSLPQTPEQPTPNAKTDMDKLAGTDIKARMAAAADAAIQAKGAKIIMQSHAAPISPQSTVDIASAAAASGK